MISWIAFLALNFQLKIFPSSKLNPKTVCSAILALAASVQSFAVLPLPHFPTETSWRSQKSESQTNDVYGPPTELTSVNDGAIKESSGLVASRNSPGIYWTHNDSGAGPLIYAFDTGGVLRGSWRVAGASAYDWEDIAAGPGPIKGKNYLYIGDIGDNREKRNEIIVYRIPEPAINESKVTKSKSPSTEPAEIIRLRYPDGVHNAEALLVHPSTGNLYIVTKVAFGKPGIYEAVAPLKSGRTTTLTRVGTLEIPTLFGGLITGGAISPDGRRVTLCDYLQGYEAVLPQRSTTFNAVWTQPLTIVNLGNRKQGEAITYRLDGKALLMTSEGSPMPLIQVVRR